MAEDWQQATRISAEEITDDIDRRIAAGAAVLDKINPGWPQLIDLHTLDLTEADSCVLGQLYGEYYVGRGALLRAGCWDHSPTLLGFAMYSDDVLIARGFIESLNFGYTLLQDRWEAFIAARRESA